jgi:hypothetical protein
MKNNSNKIEILTNEKESLLNEFRNMGPSLFKNEKYKEISNRISEIEKEVKELKLIDKINSINNENRIKKDLISQFLKVGIINEKFITNDGKLNKNLEKQNPLLYKLTNEHEARFGFDHDMNVQVRIYKGYKTIEFSLTYVDYKVQKQDRVQILFDSLEKACKGNNTLFTGLKFSIVKRQLENINKATEKMKLHEIEYKKLLEQNNCYFLDNEKFLNNYNSHIYLKSY